MGVGREYIGAGCEQGGAREWVRLGRRRVRNLLLPDFHITLAKNWGSVHLALHTCKGGKKKGVREGGRELFSFH